jgi:hypothetical protein
VDEAIDIRTVALGADHPRVASAQIVRANVLLADGRYDEALVVAEVARSLLLDSLPEDHWIVASAASAAGGALAGLGSYADAEPLLLSSVVPLQSAPIPGVVEQNRKRLEDLYLAWGKPDMARQYAMQD